MLRRCDGGRLNDVWELPGGRADSGESPRIALEREVLEEAGLSVRAGEHVQSRAWRTRSGMAVRELTFVCHLRDERQLVVLSDEHSEFYWATIDDQPLGEMTDNIFDYLQSADLTMQLVAA